MRVANETLRTAEVAADDVRRAAAVVAGEECLTTARDAAAVEEHCRGPMQPRMTNW